MKTKQLIEKLKEYIKALEKRVGNYELSHIELINLRHSICILEGKLEFASIEQKREQILEILRKNIPFEKVADAILALDEQKENKTAEEILREHPDAPIISTSPTRRMLINDIIDAMKEYRQQPQKVEQEAKPNKRIMKNIFHVGFMACHGGMELKEANKWFDKTYKIEEEEKPTKRMKSE